MAKGTLRHWPDRHKRPSFWWVTALGSGMLRPAPGTWGSALGLAAGYGLVAIGTHPGIILLLVALITAISSKVIDRIEQALGFHDASEIVIDEVAGQWLAILPICFLPHTPWAWAAAFGLFRIFDIIKPWPIGWLDRRVHGGFGVMVDDLVAGLFAALGLWLLLTFELLG
ncbi:MAG: phosphatidylglycerophosphatase A [Alphaproteobacteria bacterium]|nr:MAG: phosphatidylglycerophosphatase A [Alphaproteobacteria bacterium]